jgi:hypothetical protein
LSIMSATTCFVVSSVSHPENRKPKTIKLIPLSVHESATLGAKEELGRYRAMVEGLRAYGLGRGTQSKSQRPRTCCSLSSRRRSPARVKTLPSSKSKNPSFVSLCPCWRPRTRRSSSRRAPVGGHQHARRHCPRQRLRTQRSSPC